MNGELLINGKYFCKVMNVDKSNKQRTSTRVKALGGQTEVIPGPIEPDEIAFTTEIPIAFITYDDYSIKLNNDEEFKIMISQISGNRTHAFIVDE